jgi:hypothetical protein
VDCSAYTKVTLKFNHFFDWNQDEICNVDARAGGSIWRNVVRYQGQDAPEQVALDISSIAAGRRDVQIRWHYYNANYDNFWGIDNVEISGTH